MPQSEQHFLNDLDKRLWSAANKLRANLDAARYKHAVLGLVFLKYVSVAFEKRRVQLEEQFRNPSDPYFTDPDDFDSPAEYDAFLAEELEQRDYYTEKNVFWVPPLARWDLLKTNARLAAGTQIELPGGETYDFKALGRLVDDALETIEKANPRLKGVLNKTYAGLELPQDKLAGLIDLISEIPFQHGELSGKDILGHVYEYFLGEFALAEGKKGGQYYTPKSIVSLIVEMLQPFRGRVYDPAMGSGGFFVQSEEFLRRNKLSPGDISIYGQESNPTTWRLAAMNMAIRGLDFDFGKEAADSFTADQHPDLRADYVMANPPFNVKDWYSASLEDDPRWAYGLPPESNANFAWIQHMLYHLAPTGSMALLLSNGSMSTSTSGEGDIRRKLVEADLVECMVALPGQLFTNTQIPACIWLLTKSKAARGDRRDRAGETLFLDARDLGYMKDRVLRDFTPNDIARVAGTFHAWQRGEEYADEPGFCQVGYARRDCRPRLRAHARPLRRRARRPRRRRAVRGQNGAADRHARRAVRSECRAGRADQAELGGAGLCTLTHSLYRSETS